MSIQRSKSWSCVHQNVFDKSYVTYNEVPVGSYEKEKSPYGAYDMVGSVFEWVADWYDYDYYSTYLADQWPRNPTGPTIESDDHVLRGGTVIYNGLEESRVTYRTGGFVDWAEGGVRCARDIP